MPTIITTVNLYNSLVCVRFVWPKSWTLLWLTFNFVRAENFIFSDNTEVSFQQYVLGKEWVTRTCLDVLKSLFQCAKGRVLKLLGKHNRTERYIIQT